MGFILHLRQLRNTYRAGHERLPDLKKLPRFALWVLLKLGVGRIIWTADIWGNLISCWWFSIFIFVKVGTTAANGDREIGDLIAKAMEKVGKDGDFIISVSCLRIFFFFNFGNPFRFICLLNFSIFIPLVLSVIWHGFYFLGLCYKNALV